MYIRTLAFAALFLAAPAFGESIYVANLHPTDEQETNGGVHVRLTGPQDLPQIYGSNWEVMGATIPLLVNSGWAHLSSGSATFDRPVSKIEFTVSRANDSRWMNLFTLEGSNDGKIVADNTVNLQPVGDKTRVTISAPEMDEIKWSGKGWVFHPYDVRGMKVTFAAAVESDPETLSGGPQVGGGTAVPEPGTLALAAMASAGLLLRRRGKV